MDCELKEEKQTKASILSCLWHTRHCPLKTEYIHPVFSLKYDRFILSFENLDWSCLAEVQEQEHTCIMLLYIRLFLCSYSLLPPLSLCLFPWGSGVSGCYGGFPHSASHNTHFSHLPVPLSIAHIVAIFVNKLLSASLLMVSSLLVNCTIFVCFILFWCHKIAAIYSVFIYEWFVSSRRDWTVCSKCDPLKLDILIDLCTDVWVMGRYIDDMWCWQK